MNYTEHDLIVKTSRTFNRSIKAVDVRRRESSADIGSKE